MYGFLPFGDIIGYGIGGGVAGALIGVLVVLCVLCSTAGIALYVLQSLGLFVAAKRRGIRNYGLAWVPVAYVWILGSMADQYDLAVKGEEKGYRRKLIGLSIAVVAASFVGSILLGVAAGIGFFGDSSMGIIPAILGVLVLLAVLVLTIILAVFQYIALYKFYMSCKPENAVVFLVLGIFFQVLTPIFLFVSRNQDLGFPVREPEYGGCCEPEEELEEEPKQEPEEPVGLPAQTETAEEPVCEPEKEEETESSEE